VRRSLQWHLNRIRGKGVYDVEAGEVLDLDGVKVQDHGDVEVIGYDHGLMLERTEGPILGLLESGVIPVIIGGDHSVSLPGLRALHSMTESAMGIIQMDAHLDLVDDSPVQGRFSGSSEIRRALELDRVAPSNLIQVGVRGYNYPDQLDYIRRSGIRQIPAPEFRRVGAGAAAREALEVAASGTDRLYLTLDIDVLDPAYAPGSGADEPGGLSSREVMEFVRLVAPRVSVIDIVEVNPMMDFRGMTSAVAARIIMDFIVSVVRARKAGAGRAGRGCPGGRDGYDAQRGTQ
jgi:formiminoglutamase/agmatinase